MTSSSVAPKISLPCPLKDRPKHLAQRLYTMYERGYLESDDTSKIAYTIQYGSTTKVPKFKFAFELIAIPVNEYAIKADPLNIRSDFYGLVNSSYAASGSTFESSSLYTIHKKKKGITHGYSAPDIIGCLAHHGFVFYSAPSNSKLKLPCAILGNLISERIDYTEKSKAKMDMSPYTSTIVRAVEKIASKVPTYKSIGVSFSSDSDRYTVTRISRRYKAPKIKDIVYQMLYPRIQIVKAGGKYAGGMHSQDNLWYNALPLFNAKGVKYSNDSRAHFKTCIRDLCKEYDVAREQIGLYASPWGAMYFRGQWYDISFDTLAELKGKGTDIIFIEKRDTVKTLGRFADIWGIALVNTHGHLSEYTEDLSKLAMIAGGNIAILTDYDTPGILIASKLPQNIPRLGVDETTLDYFDINDKDDTTMVIPYIPEISRIDAEVFFEMVRKDKRFNEGKVDTDFLHKHKIEIDAVIAKVKEEKFWDYMLKKLGEEYKTRNYLRVIDPRPDLSKHYPEIIRQLDLFVENHAKNITEPQSKKIEEELKQVEGFIEVKKKEKEILDERLGKILEQDQTLSDIAEHIESFDHEQGFGISDVEIPEEEEEEEPEQQQELTIQGVEQVEEEVFETDNVVDEEDDEGGHQNDTE